MAFLVRKLNKRENYELIGQSDDIEQMYADGVTGEFRTKRGTLSTWYIDSLDSVEEAVLAIVVTSEKISKMDFVIIDTNILDDNELEYAQTYAGQEIAVPDLQNTHYDIQNITIPKLLNCAKVLKCVYDQDNEDGIYMKRYVEGEIKDLLAKAYKCDRIDLTKLKKNMKKELGCVC